MTADDAIDGVRDLRLGVPLDEIDAVGRVVGHVDGQPALLIRGESRLFAVGASCPHYGAPLEEGLVTGDTLRCPWHHAAFDLSTGAATRPPALDTIPCWNVNIENGIAVVAERRDTPLAHAARGSRVGAVVIIGAGAAGVAAADTLRKAGFTGAVTLIDAAGDPPCDRPNLSKDFLAGQAAEDWILLRSPDWYREHQIDLVCDKWVTAIDVAGRCVHVAGGLPIPFDRLLIATGAEPVKLQLPRQEQPVFYLRSVADSRAIIEAAKSAKSAVVLGASFIGLEVAASLRQRGLPVTVIAPESMPLERVLGVEIGQWVKSLHEEHGVSFRLGHTAASITADAVELDSGERIPADLVVAGIGVRPSTALADRAGLETDKGILVDQYLETSSPGIYAAGDVARWPDAYSGARLRVEHWVVAQRQGQVAARNMLALHPRDRESFDAVPFFWSRHYDSSIGYVGHADTWDRVDIDGDLAEQSAKVTFWRGDRALAVATIGRDHESLSAELEFERAGSVVDPYTGTFR